VSWLTCGRYLCHDCIRTVQGKPFCPACIEGLQQVAPRSPRSKPHEGHDADTPPPTEGTLATFYDAGGELLEELVGYVMSDSMISGERSVGVLAGAKRRGRCDAQR
jgi:hypothetical protein